MLDIINSLISNINNILDAKDEKIIGNNEYLFAYIQNFQVTIWKKLSNVNIKHILVVSDNFFMFSIQDNWC